MVGKPCSLLQQSGNRSMVKALQKETLVGIFCLNCPLSNERRCR